MKPDDIQLMAYVDGTLPARERSEVEQSISSTPDAAERLALFQSSQLPYADAFASQKLPPVPASLAAKIEEMARLAKAKAEFSAHLAAAPHDMTAGPEHGASANDATAGHSESDPASSSIWSRLSVASAWLGVAFVAGAFACGFVLRLGTGAGSASTKGALVASVGTGVSPWIAAAASYQQLYSRETLADVKADPELSERTALQIRRDDGLAVQIPDLRSAGLTFKRVQRLRFNNQPLVQIVYLPENGPPVALCVMKERKPDAAVSDRLVASMNVVTWRHAELGYALIAQPGGVDLTALGKQISTNMAAPLYGLVGEPASELAGPPLSSHAMFLASAE
jgi:anti-sigma factor RsiW